MYFGACCNNWNQRALANLVSVRSKNAPRRCGRIKAAQPGMKQHSICMQMVGCASSVCSCNDFALEWVSCSSCLLLHPDAQQALFECEAASGKNVVRAGTTGIEGFFVLIGSRMRCVGCAK